MDIGEVVSYRLREYRIRGFDPEGVTPQHVYLEDILSRRRLTVMYEQLRNQSSIGRAHLRLVERRSEGTEDD